MSSRMTYPRVVGETGKNFHFIDESCTDNIEEVVDYTIESAFNYLDKNVVLVQLCMFQKNYWKK